MTPASKVHSIHEAPRSPFFRPSTPHVVVASRKTKQGATGGAAAAGREMVKEHKSGLIGCSANMMSCIVGSGIVGMPFAIKQTGFVAGISLIMLCAFITEKSLRLLVSTAKHIHVPTYETAAEAAFGMWGFRFILVNMFIMAYGAMVSYLIIVRNSFSMVLQVDDPLQRQGVLLIVSSLIQLPLSCLRDMAQLDKTSRLAVFIDIMLVGFLAFQAPWLEGLRNLGGWSVLFRTDTIHYDTIFVGMGVLSFAFECQESAFLVAGSLEQPTFKRWSVVTASALTMCCILSMICGVVGYIGYQEETRGNILNNLDPDSLSGNLAQGALGLTMLFVYPLSSFVARHVCVVLLFEGKRAHDGEDSSILNRRDRRIGLTVVLYILALIPAMFFQDMGIVLSLAGTIGGSCLAYVGTGMLYLGVHGGRFLELVNDSWLVLSWEQRSRSKAGLDGSGRGTRREPTLAVETTPLVSSVTEAADMVSGKQLDDEEQMHRRKQQSPWFRALQSVVWYGAGFPLWCRIASRGRTGLTKHVQDLATHSPHPIRIGDVEYTLVEVSQSGRVEVDCEQSAVVISFGRSDSLPLPALGKERISLDQQIGRDLLERRKSHSSEALEPDPQEEPPSWQDFLTAIFYVCFGVVALLAGLTSLYASSLPPSEKVIVHPPV